MKRQIIKINEEKCNGCGECVPNCAEGALQIIDGKARLVSDIMCDGLGACIGHCPLDAISFEEREAEAYDEEAVLKDNIIPAGENTLKAHLVHLREHGETEYLRQAITYLRLNNIPVPDLDEAKGGCASGGCPGSTAKEIKKSAIPQNSIAGVSELQQWPVQLHLISPMAGYFKNADILVAADCTAFAVGDFHNRFLKDKKLVIACPKLDSGSEIYIEKLTKLIDDANVNTITVVIMEVPCCQGLIMMAKEALNRATRKVPIKKVVVSISGETLKEEWV